MFGYAGWYSKKFYRELLFFIPFQQLFLLPPILYFYVKSSLNNAFKFKRQDLLHFLPAFVYLLYSLLIWVADKFILGEFYFYENGRDKDFDLWYQLAGFIFMVFYLFRCLQVYSIYRKNTYETVSYADTILLTWIQRFLAAFLLLLIIRLLYFIINPEWENFGSKYWYYVAFSILFYYIAVSGYAHAIKLAIHFPDEQLTKGLIHKGGFARVENPLETEEELSAITYDESLKNKIEVLMEREEIFKNAELTLFDLATMLDTHPKKISMVINRGFEMNFNDFVNAYRTKAVIKAMELKDDKVKSLLGIAYDAGFNSKSTFNRAFKKQTRMSPKDFLAAIRNK